MKTKLFSFLSLLVVGLSTAQINISESFETAFPTGWTTTGQSLGFTRNNNTTYSCSGSWLMYTTLYSSNMYSAIYTSAYVSDGNPISVSFQYNRGIGSITGNAYLYYEVNNSGSWQLVSSSSNFNSGCKLVQGTIAASNVPAGASVRFRMQLNMTNSGNVAVYIDNFNASQVLPLSSTEYTFNNTLNNTVGTNPFGSNVGTSFVADRNGNANSALNILNSGTSATIPGLPYGNAPRTISFWAKTNTMQSPYNVTFSYGLGSLGNACGGSFNDSNIDFFGYGSSYNTSAATSNTANTWYCFTYVYDGVNAKIYKNGVLLNSTAKSWNTINNSNIFKLGIGVAGELSFDGAIDDLKIFGYALTDTQISNLYNYNSLENNSLAYQFNFDNNYQDTTGTKSFGSVGNFEADRNGVANKALRLNNLGTFTNLNGIPVGNASRSVSIWFKMYGFNSDNFLFSYGSSTSNQSYGFSLTSNQINNYAWANDLTHTTSIPLNTWKHLVVTFDSATDVASIYLNGVLITSAVKSAWNTSNDVNFYLGASPNSGDFFNGAVDDLKIYNYPLTQTEITNLYNNNVLTASDFNQNNLKVSMYPNPVQEVLNIQTETNLKSIEIYNLQGQKVLEAKQNKINISNLKSGVYMVRIEDENSGVANKRIIKE
ncbi:MULTISPECIES: LamG-like jellyroll fold domain-containing protein [Flavobacterium]|uniref:LamG-like jellyroll fold domain-containing protein n=1 Tax=Flavobacterium hankyongi TaxID=1176532 RepID=A0ABP9A9U4_9FLAO|nr:LamG-like jellyroll fold domain-containing protein [Flavobacterium sp. N1846]